MDVTVQLQGSIAARTGTHAVHLGVPDGATVRDVVDALAEECGTQVRSGVLDDDRLRRDTLALRHGVDADERLTAASHVESGDTLRFRHSD